MQEKASQQAVWRSAVGYPESLGPRLRGRRAKLTDITHIRIVGGLWLYLCVVVDLYSGIVVGWSMSRCQNRQLVMQAVLMALWQRESRQPVILHSDRGCQFTSDEYQRSLKATT